MPRSNSLTRGYVKTMLQLHALCQHLDILLSSSAINDACPNGLQIEGRGEVKKVATAVSASLATIEAAVQEGVDALIVHHGLFWRGDSYVIKGTKSKKLALLFKHDMSLLAYHLPLDMHPTLGNNWKAALDLGWEDLQPFGFYNGAFIGVKGRVPLQSREAFKVKLEAYYEHAAVCAWGGPSSIETAALISGGAYKQIGEAAREKVDAFITGNFDEPAWHDAYEENVNFLALGHSATERIGPRALSRYIQEEWNVPSIFIDVENPF